MTQNLDASEQESLLSKNDRAYGQEIPPPYAILEHDNGATSSTMPGMPESQSQTAQDPSTAQNTVIVLIPGPPPEYTEDQLGKTMFFIGFCFAPAWYVGALMSKDEDWKRRNLVASLLHFLFVVYILVGIRKSY